MLYGTHLFCFSLLIINSSKNNVTAVDDNDDDEVINLFRFYYYQVELNSLLCSKWTADSIIFILLTKALCALLSCNNGKKNIHTHTVDTPFLFSFIFNYAKIDESTGTQ